MSTPFKPDWLSSDQGLSPEVLEALRLADAEDGTAAQVARLEARLAPLWSLDAPAPEGALPSAVNPRVGSRVSLTGGKLLTAALLVIGAGALMWPTHELAQRTVVPPPSAATAPRRAPVVEPLREVVTAPVAVAALPEPVPAEQPAVQVVSAPDKQVGGLAAEARMLRRARQALTTRPEEALRLTDRHRLRFPAGVLTEEREAIAIKALRGLGREQAAQAREKRFAQRYPESPHRASLHGVVGD